MMDEPEERPEEDILNGVALRPRVNSVKRQKETCIFTVPYYSHFQVYIYGSTVMSSERNKTHFASHVHVHGGDVCTSYALSGVSH